MPMNHGQIALPNDGLPMVVIATHGKGRAKEPTATFAVRIRGAER